MSPRLQLRLIVVLLLLAWLWAAIAPLSQARLTACAIAPGPPRDQAG